MTGEHAPWTQVDFTIALAKQCGIPAALVFERFYGWSLARPYIRWTGARERGPEPATFWPAAGLSPPLLVFRADGELEVPLEQLQTLPFATEAWRAELLGRLADATGEEGLREATPRDRPTFPIGALADEQTLQEVGAVYDGYAARALGTEGTEDGEVVLYRLTGATESTIVAYVDDTGRLQLAGDDYGEAPRQSFGKDDYEYRLSVDADDLPRLLLDLLFHKHGGDGRVVSRLKSRLDELGIESNFFAY